MIFHFDYEILETCFETRQFLKVSISYKKNRPRRDSNPQSSEGSSPLIGKISGNFRQFLTRGNLRLGTSKIQSRWSSSVRVSTDLFICHSFVSPKTTGVCCPREACKTLIRSRTPYPLGHGANCLYHNIFTL